MVSFFAWLGDKRVEAKIKRISTVILKGIVVAAMTWVLLHWDQVSVILASPSLP